MTDILVIGGGASGLSAAVFAARSGVRVKVVERQPRVGKKLLATGNGRCNILNDESNCMPHYHGNTYLAEGALKAFPPDKIIDFFESIGVSPVPEEDGRMYPAGNQAAGVLDALRLAADEAGVETVCDFHATDISRTGSGFTVTSDNGGKISAKAVIFAVGSPAGKGMGSFDLKLAEKLGHRVTPLLPALTQLKSRHPLLPFLKGQRVKGGVTLLIDGRPAGYENGEILFQEYGLSGIAVMQLSGRAAAALGKRKITEVSLDIAGFDGIGPRARRLPERRLEDIFTGVLPKRVGQAVIRDAGIADLTRTAGSLNANEITAVDEVLGDWRFGITGVNGFESAQVAHGGLDGRDFDRDTLSSLSVPGFFAAGEALDVDGDCGGYNLRWAWASGMLAARSAVQYIKNK